MLNESSRQHTRELAEESKKSIVDLKRETADAISRIKKNVVDSTAEIKRMKTTTIKQNTEAAKIACKKLLASKSRNCTCDQIAHEADDAAELVLSAADVSRIERESKSALAIEHIRMSMKTAQDKIKSICDSAVVRIEAARNAAIKQLESVINDRLAVLG
ncbi:MAG: hypothetical protein ACI82H_001098 [Alphaproteobacteria bacterium]|jgi:hypothetical protein